MNNINLQIIFKQSTYLVLTILVLLVRAVFHLSGGILFEQKYYQTERVRERSIHNVGKCIRMNNDTLLCGIYTGQRKLHDQSKHIWPRPLLKLTNQSRDSHAPLIN
jgi:hypothetical protein